MYGQNDSLALLRELLEHLHDTVRRKGVQARGGLITDEQGRIGECLRSESKSLALATRQTLDTSGHTDDRVLALAQRQLLDDLIDPCHTLAIGQLARHAHHGLEDEMLACRQRTDEQIILLHIGTACLHLLGIHGVPVQHAHARRGDLHALWRAEGQGIQQRCLASARTAHHSEQFPRVGHATN